MNKFFIMIGGHWFSDTMYRRLLSHFKEAFSHTSVSIEEAFSELRECDYIIDTTGSSESVAIYSLLPENEKKKIQFALHQMIVFKGYLVCSFHGTREMVINDSERLYNKYFSYFEKYIYRSEGLISFLYL